MRKYLRKLAKSLHDGESVATEMFLAWIAIVLTMLAIVGILDIILH